MEGDRRRHQIREMHIGGRLREIGICFFLLSLCFLDGARTHFISAEYYSPRVWLGRTGHLACMHGRVLNLGGIDDTLHSLSAACGLFSDTRTRGPPPTGVIAKGALVRVYRPLTSVADNHLCGGTPDAMVSLK